jgi:hypothetical protein
LIGGLVLGSVVGLLVGLVGGLLLRLVFGLLFGLVGGLLFGLDGGWNSWLYNYWLRRRLAHSHCLPARLGTFLDWCALPPRNWLRVSDAYEFRHRDLLDHLVATSPGHPQKKT